MAGQDARMLLRRRIRAERTALAAAPEWKDACLCIQQGLLAHRCWKRAENIVLYIAVKGEVDTALLLGQAWESGKNVFLPRCRKGGEMDLVRCSSLDELVISSFGIPEPPLCPGSILLKPGEMSRGTTLVVTPALAFDRLGFRLGYGGGYYDRLFAHSECVSAGLAYEALVLPFLPREPWDRPVDLLCTEKGIQEMFGKEE